MIKEFSVAIVDDEPKALDELDFWVSRMLDYNVKFKTTNPEEIVDKIKNKEFHILITDIDMPLIFGFELADLAIQNNIPVLICSAYPQYSLDTMQIGAEYFITKPPRFKELKDALDRAKAKIIPNKIYEAEDFERMVFFKSAGHKTYNSLILDDIIFIEHSANITTIHLVEDKVKIRIPLITLYHKLNFPKLLQLHKSFYINTDYIKSVTGHELTLANGIKCTIGRTYLAKVHNFLENKTIN